MSEGGRAGERHAGAVRPVRVYVAGARDSVITEAVRDAIAARPDVVLAGVELGRLDRDRLRAADAHLLVSAAHEHFIPAALRACASIGAVGIHPSLLPRYRGSWPLWWALRDGEAEVGVSLFHIVDRMDAGPVIAQRRLAVAADDTFASLYERVRPLVGSLVVEAIEHVATHGALPAGVAQDEERATVVRTPGIAMRLLLRGRLEARRLARRVWR